MEELAGFIPIIIIAVISILSKAAKNQQKAQQHPYQQGMNSARPPAPAAKPATFVQPAQHETPATAVQPAAAPVSMVSMLPRSESAAMQPRVHAHLEPDCETHDAPAMGSLGFVSSEGKDPCHEDQLPQRTTVAATQSARPGIALDWSGEAMVRAFVMQEVLTRPCDRRRR